MKAFLFFLTLVISSASFANECEKVEGSHTIKSGNRVLQLGYSVNGELQVSDGDSGLHLASWAAGGVSKGITLAPNLFAKAFMLKNVMSGPTIQFFGKAKYPKFYSKISDRFSEELDSLETDEANDLLISCMKERIHQLNQ